MRFAILALFAALPLSAAEPVSPDALVGVYGSGAEIAGFSSTRLMLSKDLHGSFSFRMVLHSDVVVIDDVAPEIKQDPIRGAGKMVGDALVIAWPLGFLQDGKPVLFSHIEVYHPLIVNGRLVLMREDSYKTWTEKGQVYDYGILVKVRTDAKEMDLNKEPMPEIRMAEIFGIDKWKDPFVNGPNQGK